MSDTEKTDFKGLRKKVAELEDTLIKLKRTYDDLLLNLDESNFASSVIRERDGIRVALEVLDSEVSSVVSKTAGAESEISKIKQTAGAIETEVSRLSGEGISLRTALSQTADEIKSLAERTEGAEKNVSEVRQTADEITHTVSTLSGEVETLGSEVRQTAEDITHTVSTLSGEVETLESEIRQSADEIKSVVSWNFDGAEVVDSFSTVPNPDKKKVYFDSGSGVYYYYYKNSWHESEKAGIESFFVQDADGFSLSGDVRICGNVFSDGTISGTSIYDADMVQKIELTDDSGLGNGTFCIYNTSYYPEESGAVPYFSVFDGSLGNISLMCYGESFLGVRIAKDIDVMPLGVWDFSDATVTGLDSTVAVFG